MLQILIRVNIQLHRYINHNESSLSTYSIWWIPECVITSCTTAEQGHVMHILPRLRQNRARVQLRTDYRVTDGYCLELYHLMTGPAVLTVKTRGEDYIERNIVSTEMETKVIIQQCFRAWAEKGNHYSLTALNSLNPSFGIIFRI